MRSGCLSSPPFRLAAPSIHCVPSFAQSQPVGPAAQRVWVHVNSKGVHNIPVSVIESSLPTTSRDSFSRSRLRDGISSLLGGLGHSCVFLLAPSFFFFFLYLHPQEPFSLLFSPSPYPQASNCFCLHKVGVFPVRERWLWARGDVRRLSLYLTCPFQTNASKGVFCHQLSPPYYPPRAGVVSHWSCAWVVDKLSPSDFLPLSSLTSKGAPLLAICFLHSDLRHPPKPHGRVLIPSPPHTPYASCT